MAVARLDPVYLRRLDAASVRVKPPSRLHFSPRTVAVGALLSGALLQHVLATTPPEPQPAPLVAQAAVSIPPAISTGSVNIAPALRLNGVKARPAPVPAGHSGTPVHTAALRHQPVVAQHEMHSQRQIAALAPRPSLQFSALSPDMLRRAMSLPPVGPAGDSRRSAMAPNPQGLIMHVPSVSVAAIRTALRAAGSPTLAFRYADHKDVGEYIWDAGRVLGVDPAVLMAIFHHESVFGTQGMARLTRSVGNIRPLDGQPSLDGYRLYSSWQEGIDDCYRLLRDYARHGAGTIPLAIPIWAPPSDSNDDGAYISSVLSTMSSLYAASGGQ